MPLGLVKPVLTVVTLKGVSVTIDTDPAKFAVQIRCPSKAIPKVESPKVARTGTAPAGWVGSIWYSLPGLAELAMKTFPIAHNTLKALVVPVQVSSSLPSLPLTRETVLEREFATHRSAPSDWTSCGEVPTVVSPLTP